MHAQLVSALRTSKGKDGKSPFERHTGRKPNTITSLIVKLYKELNDLDYDKNVDLDRLQDFPRDDDSTIFVRERQRKGKLTGLFKKRRGKVTAETSHTVKFIPEGKTDETVLSKREVARVPKPARKQRAPKRVRQYALGDIDKQKQENTQVFAELEQEERIEQDDPDDMPEKIRRSRRAPDRYGFPVYICEVKEKKKAAKN